jgi:hypothetical protein
MCILHSRSVTAEIMHSVLAIGILLEWNLERMITFPKQPGEALAQQGDSDSKSFSPSA